MSLAAGVRFGGGGFQKAQKLFDGSAEVFGLEIQYNKSSMTLQLKFMVSRGGGGGGDGWYDDDECW
jgi:hypothetical protein